MGLQTIFPSLIFQRGNKNFNLKRRSLSSFYMGVCQKPELMLIVFDKQKKNYAKQSY